MPHIDCRCCGETLDVPDLLAAANMDCPQCDGKVFGASTASAYQQPIDPNSIDPVPKERASVIPQGGKIGMVVGALVAVIGVPIFATYDEVNGRALVGALGGAVIAVVLSLPDLLWGYYIDSIRYFYRNKYELDSLKWLYIGGICICAYLGSVRGGQIKELTPAIIFCGTLAGLVVGGFLGSILGKWVAEFFD